MFIKVFVPNANGKIELTVQELEALLKDAANKAVSEQCAKCYKSNWWGSTGSITYASNPVKELANPVWDPYEITCSDAVTSQSPNTKNAIENITYLNGGLTIAKSDNPIGTTTCASSLTRKINQLIGD